MITWALGEFRMKSSPAIPRVPLPAQRHAQARARVVNSRSLVGDADTNNSVIHEVTRRGSAPGTPAAGHQPDGPGPLLERRLRRLPHLARCSPNDDERPGVLGHHDRYGRQPVTLLLSAGGGTGGGISGAFRQQPPDGAATLPNVRLFAVLPELDQFQDGGPDIRRAGRLQCASAGRSCFKFLSDAARVEAGSLPQSASADLFILSNSYLS